MLLSCDKHCLVLTCLASFPKALSEGGGRALPPAAGVHSQLHHLDRLLDHVSNNDEFCIQNEKLCIKNEELCINNETLCIKNEELCINNETLCIKNEEFSC